MKLDDFYKWLGYGIVCLLLLYVVSKSIKFQVGVVEGMVNLAVGKKKTKEVAQTNGVAEANEVV